MDNNDTIKKIVKEQYTEIAKATEPGASCFCCCTGPTDQEIYTTFHQDYSGKDGYVKNADLGLGCGIPTDAVQLKIGETVVDLGSGAGNDVFIAQRIVGKTGRVIGIDMTQAMIDRARENARTLGCDNVEFRLGDIEAMPLDNAVADVVVSNCVINLVPDKRKVFDEIQRILKPAGRFGISDIVVTGSLPAKIQSAAEMYAGCIAGALLKEEYLNTIAAVGFVNLAVKKETVYAIPDAALLKYLSQDEINDYRNSGVRILSITVYGEKA